MVQLDTLCSPYVLLMWLYTFVMSQERLDFSCALFGPDGGLVANAPHIPVHLGAMQETVQWQVSNVLCMHKRKCSPV